MLANVYLNGNDTKINIFIIYLISKKFFLYE